MSKVAHLTISVACIVALALLLSASTPAAFADTGSSPAKTAKKKKSQKSADKKSAQKPAASKPSDAKPADKYDEFEDDNAKGEEPASDSATKTAVKAAEKALVR